ncbi:MAG TPA: hypothetical protein VN743_06950 [Blastocatellia bacterium]|nr:hypothetical protein [Blastocatellia bacterium]
MKDRPKLILMTLAIALMSSSCVKPPAQNANAESAKSAAQNANSQAAIPLYAQDTARGDLDRAGLSAASALASAQQRKWQDTVTNLKQTASHLDKALSAGRNERERVQRVELEINDARRLIDEAIKSAERSSSETTAQVQRVQSAIGAIKTKIAL